MYIDMEKGPDVKMELMGTGYRRVSSRWSYRLIPAPVRRGRKVTPAVFALVALLSCLFAMPLALADDTPVLKPDVPKLDPSADRKPEPEGSKKSGPLQAKIEHSEKLVPKSSFFGKLRAGAKKAESTPLKSRVTTGNSNGLTSQVTSGFGIIGVKFVLAFGRPPVINRVFPGTPAFKVGLRNNDIIVAVDGVPTYGLSKEEVYDLIIGSPGTPVTISVMRGGDFQVVTCTRMDINELTDPIVRRDYLMSM